MSALFDERNDPMPNVQSMLVVTRDGALTEGLDHVETTGKPISLTAETGHLARLNGRVQQMARDKDVIVVQTDPHDPDDIAALRVLVRSKRPGASVVALADENLSLADVQLLNDAGVERVLPVPHSADALVSELSRIGAARQVTSPVASTPSKAAGRIIATLPARGGIGATTLSVNLAESLAAPRGFGRSRTRAKVALVDLDLQFGSVGSMLDLPEHDALARLAGEGTLPDVTFLRQAMLDHPSGLRVMPAPSTFVPQDALGVAQVAAIIDVLRTEFDYVVIDLPHAVARWIEPVISATDMVLLVADLSVPVVRQGRRLTELLTADNPAIPLRLVASREDKPMFRSSTQREAERALERPVWAWLPPDQKHARAAADQGRPLRAVGGVLSKAINRLARQVERELNTSSAVAKGV